MPEERTSELFCPTCRQSVQLQPGLRPATFPFCSPRCRAADLVAWAEGRYTIASRQGWTAGSPEDDLAGGTAP